jgi:glycosyltransferase involved in cell wall biosynthesis
MSTRLIVISPVRNEGEHLSRTINSVVNQLVKPDRWIIVNDGSSDSTGQLAEQAATNHDWIQVIHRQDRGSRKSGVGVVDTFYDGYRLIEKEPWDYLVKLDGDLHFGSDVFEKILLAFSEETKLGISGGEIFYERNGQRTIESKRDPAFHVRGATKFYRRACWDKMGGLLPVTGWDTLDEVKANMLGWTTKRVPEAHFLHLRPTGAADGSWRDSFKNGRGSYIAGYHPIYMLSKCVRRLPCEPAFIQSLGLFAGFFSGFLSSAERIKDRELVRYLRRQQLRRLLGRASIWE